MKIHIPIQFRIEYHARYKQVRQSYSIRYGNKVTFHIYIN